LHAGYPRLQTKWRMRIACWIPKATNKMAHAHCMLDTQGYKHRPSQYVIYYYYYYYYYY